MSREVERERLRQESAAFDQRHEQSARLFRLRLLFGYLALCVFAGVAAFAGLFAYHADFSPTSIAISGSILIGNAISLVTLVIKWVLKP